MDPQNWYSGVPVYLEDTETSTWTNLIDGDYNYTATKTGDDNNRFKLHFMAASTPTGINDAEKINVNVYQQNDDLVINFGATIKKASISVFNILGKQVISNEYGAVSNSVRIPMSHLSTGNYIVRVNSNNVNHSQKIFKH
ncbi:T9SS type A sorting domain-containing protein [Bacteroidota bacterium]